MQPGLESDSCVISTQPGAEAVMERFDTKRAGYSAGRVLAFQPSITVGLLPRRC
jgi:hypothetical protein